MLALRSGGGGQSYIPSNLDWKMMRMQKIVRMAKIMMMRIYIMMMMMMKYQDNICNYKDTWLQDYDDDHAFWL